MKFIVSADDYAMSKEVVDNILDCFDNGVLTSTSVLANGHAFDYAMEEYKKRTGLGLSVHLNLVEGKPILSSEKVGMLVNKDGKFRHSFLSLWLEYLLSSKKERLKQQVKLEMSAQINKVKENVKKWDGSINSHQHFHLIPFVFDALLELKDELDFSYIRMAEEPFFFCCKGIKSIKNYCGLNLIKHLLLNTLSKRCKMLLSDTRIQFCDYFVGVLFTGNMSEFVVKSALSEIPVDASVEILFHHEFKSIKSSFLKELLKRKMVE